MQNLEKLFLTTLNLVFVEAAIDSVTKRKKIEFFYESFLKEQSIFRFCAKENYDNNEYDRLFSVKYTRQTVFDKPIKFGFKILEFSKLLTIGR